MFLQSSEACNLPNSETPMSQQAIDDQNAFIANVGTAFDDGDDALNSLIQALGGNPGGTPAPALLVFPPQGLWIRQPLESRSSQLLRALRPMRCSPQLEIRHRGLGRRHRGPIRGAGRNPPEPR